MLKTLLGSASLTGLMLAAPFAAVAQTTEADDSPLVQNTITVTVQKREQSLRDVPVAVSVVDDSFLRDLGLDDFEDVARFIPGFEVQEQSPNNPGFVIRGITSDSGEANIEPRIAIFQDGVSLSRSRGSIVELFDVERVEVAKGPQPTLFGRGALIGGVNIIQAKASTAETTARATIGGGNFGEVFADGAVNYPVIADTFAVRVAARYRKRDGFVESLNPNEDDFNGEDMRAVRVSFGLEPSPDVRLDLILNWQENDNTGTSFKSKVYAPAPGASVDPWEPANLNSFGGFLGGRKLGLDRTVQSATFLADWRISDSWTASSITGTRHFNSLEVFDPDGFGTELLIFAEDAKGDQLSQEIRFNYDGGGAFTGFIGGSYFKETGRQLVPLGFDERAIQAFLGGFLTAPNAPPASALPAINLTAFQQSGGLLVIPLKPFHEEFFANYGRTVALDVFADASYAVNDRLEITGGIRFTDEDKRTSIEAGNTNGPSNLTLGSIIVAPTNGRLTRSDSFEGVTWRLAAKYQLSDNVNLFGNYARGRIPEVIAPSFTNPNQRFTLLPAETVDSYEVGVKSSLLANRLLLDASVFTYEYKNFQSSIVDDGIIVPINAGNASSTGGEIQANWLVSDALNVIASYGYNNARFDKSVNGQPQQFGGNPLRLSPDHTASLAARFRAETGFGTVRVVPSYTWQSKVYFDNSKRDLISEDAYGLLNLNLGLDLPGDRFSVEAYATNLLDEKYIIDAGNTGDGFGIPTFIAGKPRFYGVRFSVAY
ncbi:TonB-dependent receptor [Hyphomonas sp.]|uniref:TonB-dependent receptor n=1 Tax=Hyphomonas sp. TaxID=87 RepID=UPI00391AD9E4